MKCEICGVNNALITVEKYKDGKIVHSHICKDCSELKNVGKFETIFNSDGFLTNLIDTVEKSNILVNDILTTKCDKCGMTYGKFKKIGRLGCKECYYTFSTRLLPIIKNFHKSEFHTGKSMKIIDKQAELIKLESSIKQAIDNENYEEAAKIRDKIKKIKSLGVDAYE